MSRSFSRRSRPPMDGRKASSSSNSSDNLPTSLEFSMTQDEEANDVVWADISPSRSSGPTSNKTTKSAFHEKRFTRTSQRFGNVAKSDNNNNAAAKKSKRMAQRKKSISELVALFDEAPEQELNKPITVAVCAENLAPNSATDSEVSAMIADDAFLQMDDSLFEALERKAIAEISSRRSLDKRPLIPSSPQKSSARKAPAAGSPVRERNLLEQSPLRGNLRSPPRTKTRVDAQLASQRMLNHTTTHAKTAENLVGFSKSSSHANTERSISDSVVESSRLLSEDLLSVDEIAALEVVEAAAALSASVGNKNSSYNDKRKSFPMTASEVATGTDAGMEFPSQDPFLCYALIVLRVDDNKFHRKKALHCISETFWRHLKATQLGKETGSSQEHLLDEMAVLVTQTPTHCVHLSGPWYESQAAIGDSVNVILIGRDDILLPRSVGNLNSKSSGASNHNQLRELVVDDSSGLLVLHPQCLITPTRLAEACTCLRRSVISERVKLRSGTINIPEAGSQDPLNSAAADVGSVAAVMGSLKHEFIEKLLKSALTRTQASSNNCTQEVERMITESMALSHEDLLAIGKSDEAVRTELQAMVDPTLSWAQQASHFGIPSGLLSGMAHSHARTDNSPKKHSKPLPSQYVIKCLSSSEESITCPYLGLKGKLDCVVEAAMTTTAVTRTNNLILDAALQPHPPQKRCLMPLELKTGKFKASQLIGHRAQVLLYILMLSFRSRGRIILEGVAGTHLSDCEGAMEEDGSAAVCMEGLLLYLHAEQTRLEVITPTWSEVVSLIATRNNLAAFLLPKRDCSSSSVMNLPPMLKNARDCTYCFQASECMLYHASLDNGNESTSGVPALYKYLLRDVSCLHITYLIYWEKMIELEESAALTNRRNTWNLPSTVLEALGKECVGQLRVLDCTMEFVLREKEEVVNHKIALSPVKGGKDPVEDALSQSQTTSKYRLTLERRPRRVSSDSTDQVGKPWKWPFRVGDNVIVSIENFNKRSDDRNLNKFILGQDGVGDIEELCSSNAAIEPNVVCGVIDSMKEAEVHILIGEYPRRLLNQHGKQRKHRISVRVDKDEGILGLTSLRSSVMSLLVDKYSFSEYSAQLRSGQKVDKLTPSQDLGRMTGKERLRSLIVDLVPPRFEVESVVLSGQNSPATPASGQCLASQGRSVTAPAAPRGIQNYPGCSAFNLNQGYKAFNFGQKVAIDTISKVKDYSIIQGFPGTGKTKVLVHIIRQLISLGQRILVTSYTHSAVDNLLMKLVFHGVNSETAVRIGSLDKVHRSVQSFVLDPNSFDSLADLKRRVGNARVFFCTALSVPRSSVLEMIPFDWCILDEAGQMLEPVAVGVVTYAKKFLLVGDHFQLPPLVQSAAAREMGMNTSLMKRLADAHPSCVSLLTEQYRMHADIMSVSNSLYYGGRMTCSKKITSLSITAESFQCWASTLAVDKKFLAEVLHLDRHVVFVNVENRVDRRTPGEQESVDDMSPTTNLWEAVLVRDIVEALVALGFDVVNELGVIAPYRRQVSLIEEKLSTLSCSDQLGLGGTPGDSGCGVEVSTMDRFQGREMEVVIVSTVKNGTCQVGEDDANEILQDWRRLNVALTRAKDKMIVLGSLSTLRGITAMASFCELVDARKWVVEC